MLANAYKYVNDAHLVYKSLDGVFLVYKPPLLHFNRLRETIIEKLCRDLNDMNVRPPTKHVSIVGDTSKKMKVIVRDSFADHTLVVGPRYQPNDFRLSATKFMSRDTSGILVCGLNKGNVLVHKMRAARSIRFYKVKGLLGQGTDNYFHTGKVLERSTYTHVRRGHIDKLCSSIQSSHQRKMFELCGADIQSQTAYELALKGPIRPGGKSDVPILYTIKCVYFSPPDFTLEIVCTNEYDMYLKSIIHDLGLHLRTNATCTQIHCEQDGLFNVKDALLSKDWNLQKIVNCMQICRTILDENNHALDPKSAGLVEATNDATKAPIEHICQK